MSQHNNKQDRKSRPKHRNSQQHPNSARTNNRNTKSDARSAVEAATKGRKQSQQRPKKQHVPSFIPNAIRPSQPDQEEKKEKKEKDKGLSASAMEFEFKPSSTAFVPFHPAPQPFHAYSRQQFSPPQPQPARVSEPVEPQIRGRKALVIRDPKTGEPINMFKGKGEAEPENTAQPEQPSQETKEEHEEAPVAAILKPEEKAEDIDQTAENYEDVEGVDDVEEEEEGEPKEESDEDKEFIEESKIGPQSYDIDFLKTLRDSFREMPDDILEKSFCLKKNRGLRKEDNRHRRNRTKKKKDRYNKRDNFVIKRAAPVKPLERTDSGWKRKMPENEKEELQRNVVFLLNLLTGQKFEKITTRILETVEKHVSDPESLRITVRLIFEKALMEPNFAPMYADLCSRFQHQFPTFEEEVGDEGEEKIVEQNFRKLLLRQCQIEFQTGMEELDLSEYDDEKKDVELYKQKSNYLGNVIFIGELFKRKMINPHIIKSCIVNLLKDFKDCEEDELEALCKLLSTAGRMLDHIDREFMDKAFQGIKKMIAEDQLPSGRIKFLLMDIVDLRDVHWKKGQRPTKKTKANTRGKKTQRQTSNTGKDSSRGGKYSRGGRKGRDSGKPRGKKGQKAEKPKQKPKPKQQPKQQPKEEKKEEVVVVEIKEPEVEYKDVEKQVASLVREYFAALDVNEVKLCIEELASKHGGNPAVYLGQVVFQSIFCAVEGKPHDRDNAAKLLMRLCKDSVLSEDDLVKGFTNLVDLMDDLMLDTPIVLKYSCNILASLILESHLSFGRFGAFYFKYTIDNGTGEKIIRQIIEAMIQASNVANVRTIVRNGPLDLTLFLRSPFGDTYFDFITCDEVREVFEEEGQILRELKEGLNEDAAEMVAGKFVNSVQAELNLYWATQAFRVAIESVVLNTTCKDGKQPDDLSDDLLEEEKHLLHELAPLMERLELGDWALYELQKLNVKLSNPSGFLSRMIQELRSLDLIEKEMFDSWKLNEHYQPGKNHVTDVAW